MTRAGRSPTDDAEQRGAQARAQGRQTRTEADLRSGAKRAFEQHGYAKATVQHILEEAGVARRTYYRYFGSKDEIFAELLDELIAAFLITTAMAAEEPSLRARVETRVGEWVRIAFEETAFLRAVDEAIRINDDHAARWRRLEKTMDGLHQDALDWCVQHGLMEPAETTVLARILTTVANSLILDAGRYAVNDLGRVKSTVVDVYWNLVFRPSEGADDYLLDSATPRPAYYSRNPAGKRL